MSQMMTFGTSPAAAALACERAYSGRPVTVPPMSTQADREADTVNLLAERGKTHGDFRENGAIMQGLKDRCRMSKNWHQLRPYQKEGIDMMMHKVGRILCGDPDVVDHWDDASGYPAKVAQIMREDGHAK